MSVILRLLLLLLAMAGPAVAEPAPLTVMTYNIRGGLGSAGPLRNPVEARMRTFDLAPVVAAIRSANADIVALQEVVGEGQAREIAAALGMSYVYARHGPVHGNWWGLAILSRHPIGDHRSDETSTGVGNTRRDLTAVLRVGARDLTVVNVHVDKDRKDGAPIRRTLDRLKSADGPLILLGDFNARRRTTRLATVRDRFADVADMEAKGAAAVRKHSTFVRGGRLVEGARIDYIFIDPKHLDVREVRLLDRAHWAASDHLGVIAVLAIKGK